MSRRFSSTVSTGTPRKPSWRSLARIEPHRLQALVFEDLSRYPDARIGEVHQRIGAEIPRAQVERALRELRASGRVTYEGERKGRRYRAVG